MKTTSAVTRFGLGALLAATLFAGCSIDASCSDPGATCVSGPPMCFGSCDPRARKLCQDPAGESCYCGNICDGVQSQGDIWCCQAVPDFAFAGDLRPAPADALDAGASD